MKFKFAVFTLSLLMVLTMSTGAFAQGVFTLSAGSEERGRDNGHAEPTGNITLFLTTGGIDTNSDDAGTVVINYGVPITNTMTSVPPIVVEVCGVETDIGRNVEIDDEDGTIEIMVLGRAGTEGTDPPLATPCDDGDSINVEGVLVSLVGSGATSVTATVTGTEDVRLPSGSNSTATVITAVVDPLIDDNVEAGETLELIRHTGKPSGGSEFHLVITEAHKDSFDGGQLELKFSGIPEDVTVTSLDAWVTTKKDFDDPDTMTALPTKQVPVNTTMSRAEPTADEDGEATVLLQTAHRIPMLEDTDGDGPIVADVQGGALNPSAVDVVVVRGMVEGADDDDLLPIDLDIQVAVDLGPTGDDNELASKGQPFFASDRTTPVDGHRIHVGPDQAVGPVRNSRLRHGWRRVRYRHRGGQYEQRV